MSLLNSWGGTKESRTNEEDFSLSRLLSLSPIEQSHLFFDSLRDGDISAIRNILQANRLLLIDKMYGFEGHDVYGIVPNVNYDYFDFFSSFFLI
jgi:hypothetical protein